MNRRPQPKREWGGPIRELSEMDEAPSTWERWARWKPGEGWTLHRRFAPDLRGNGNALQGEGRQNAGEKRGR